MTLGQSQKALVGRADRHWMPVTTTGIALYFPQAVRGPSQALQGGVVFGRRNRCANQTGVEFDCDHCSVPAPLLRGFACSAAQWCEAS
jgi:hypothetical protein